MVDRHALGAWGEDLAVAHLEAAGYDVLARNWRCREGELDIVARGGDALVFVEVKTRSCARLRRSGGGRHRRSRPGGSGCSLPAGSNECRPPGRHDLRFDVVSVAAPARARPRTSCTSRARSDGARQSLVGGAGRARRARRRGGGRPRQRHPRAVHHRAARCRAQRGARPRPGGGRQLRPSLAHTSGSRSACRRPRCPSGAAASTSPLPRRCSRPTAQVTGGRRSRGCCCSASSASTAGSSRCPACCRRWSPGRRPAVQARDRADGQPRRGAAAHRGPLQRGVVAAPRWSRCCAATPLLEADAAARGRPTEADARTGRLPRRGRPTGGAAGLRGRGGGRPQPADDRHARLRQDPARRADARHPAAAVAGRGARGHRDPLRRRAAARRRRRWSPGRRSRPRTTGPRRPRSSAAAAASPGPGRRRWRTAGSCSSTRRRSSSAACSTRCGSRWRAAGSASAGSAGPRPTRLGSRCCWPPTPVPARSRRASCTCTVRAPAHLPGAAVRPAARPDGHRRRAAAPSPGQEVMAERGGDESTAVHGRPGRCRPGSAPCARLAGTPWRTNGDVPPTILSQRWPIRAAGARARRQGDGPAAC